MLKPIQINLPDKLHPVFNGKARYRGAYGGRGGAKSVAFANMAIMTIMMPQDKPKRFLCTRELQKSLKDSVFSLIASQIEELGVQEAFDVGKEYLRCKNGNEFLFYGLRSNISEIKGLHGVKWVWNEEAQKTSQSSLNYLLPTIRETDSEIWFTWNPDDELDPVHDMLVNHTPHNAKVEKINWIDNPWFPDVLNDERLRTLKQNPQRYDWIWNGNFNTNTEGSVYGKWIAAADNEGRIRPDLYDPDLPVHTSWDLGFSDDTAIWWWQLAKNEVRWIDYYENNREGIKHYIEQLYGREVIVDQHDVNGKIIKWHFGNDIEGAEHRKDYHYGDHFAPHDAANKLLQAGGRSIIHQAQELGIRMRVVAATSQQNQIEALRTTIEKSYFDTVRCKDGIRALRKYQFIFDEDRNKYLDKPDHDGFSHACDAAEITGQVWRNPLESQTKQQTRFLHDLTAKDVFFPDTPSAPVHERI